jgi:hypothetical protein
MMKASRKLTLIPAAAPGAPVLLRGLRTRFFIETRDVDDDALCDRAQLEDY